MIIRPSIFSTFPNLVAAQTTRLGGVSEAPYNFMNLGSNTNDNPSNVEKNKKILAQHLGIDIKQFVRAKQIHSDNILVVDEAGFFNNYDALISNKPNLFLAVSTADCVPILIFDKINNVIAAIHAGWKGTKDYLVSLTLQKMNEVYGTNANNCLAYIGACIDECSFEVDADVAQYFDDPFSRFDSNKGKYFINLKAHNKSQLLHSGLLEKNIEVSPYDTYQNTELFYSHRKEKGVTGRMWSIIGIKE